MALETTGLKLVVEGANQAVRALGQYDKAVAGVTQSQSRLASLSGFSKGAEQAVAAFRKQSTAITSTSTAFQGLSKLLPQVSSAMGAFSAATGVSVPVLGSAAGAAGSFSSAIAAIPPPALAAGAAIVGLTAGFTAFLALGQRGAALQPTITAFGNLNSQFGDSTEALNRLREQTRGTVSDLELMRISTFALSGANKELGTILSQDLGNILNNTRRLAESLGRDPIEAQSRFVEAIKKNERELLDELGIIVSANAAYESYAKSIGKATSALTDQEKNTAFAIAAIDQLNQKTASLGEQSSVLSNLAVPFTVLQNILDKLSLAVQPLFGPFTEGVANLFRSFESGVNVVLPLVQVFSEVLAALGNVIFSVGELVATAILRFTPLGFVIQSLGAAIPYVVAAFQLLGSAVTSVAGSVASAIQSLTGTLDGFGVSTGVTIEKLASEMAQGGGFIIGSFAAGLLKGGSFVVTAVTKIAQIVADFLQGFSPPKKGPLSQIDKGGQNVAQAWASGFLGGIQQSTQDAAQFVTDQLGKVASLTAKDVKDRFAVLDKALQPFNEQLTIAKGIFEQIAGVAEPALKILNRQIEQAIKSKDVARLQELDKQAESLNKLKNQQQAQLDNAELQLALAKSQQAQERALLTVQQGRVKAVKDLASAAGGAEKALSDASEKAKAGGGGGQAPTTAEEGGLPIGGQAPDVLSNEAVEKAKAVLTGGFNEGLAASGFNEALADFNGQTGELQSQLGRISAAKPGDKIAASIEPIKNAFTGISTALDNTSLAVSTGLSTIQGLFTAAFGETGTITASLTTLFAEGGLLGVGGAMQTAIATIFGETGMLAVGIPFIQGLFAGLAPSIETSLNAVNGKLNLAKANFETLKTTVIKIVADMATEFVNFVSGIGGALAGLGAALKTHFTDPFLSAVNGVLGLVQDGLNNIISSLPGILGIGLVTIPKVSIPGAARGGVGLSGMTMVGERGPELINLTRPSTVFPANVSRAIMGMNQGPPSRTLYDSGGGSTTNNNSNTSNSNTTFNVSTPEQARLLDRQRRAFMGV